MNKAKRALSLKAEIPVQVPHTAMVMAAGLGKRMRPLTATKPKPLIEVGGKPLLDHVLDRLRSAGVRKVIVNVHYLASAALMGWKSSFRTSAICSWKRAAASSRQSR